MKKEEIAAQVRQVIIDQCGYPQDQVTAEKDLKNDLNFDVLDLCEFTMMLEEQFGIVIPDGDPELHTVGDWIRLVEAKLEAKGIVEE